MNWLLNNDPHDAIARAYRRLLHRLMVWGVIALVLLVVSIVVGVPHLQTSYSYRGTTPSDGIVKAWQKIDAWYVGPFGFKQVRSGKYGNEGCPYVLLGPLFDCFE